MKTIKSRGGKPTHTPNPENLLRYVAEQMEAMGTIRTEGTHGRLAYEETATEVLTQLATLADLPTFDARHFADLMHTVNAYSLQAATPEERKTAENANTTLSAFVAIHYTLARLHGEIVALNAATTRYNEAVAEYEAEQIAERLAEYEKKERQQLTKSEPVEIDFTTSTEKLTEVEPAYLPE